MDQNWIMLFECGKELESSSVNCFAAVHYESTLTNFVRWETFRPKTKLRTALCRPLWGTEIQNSWEQRTSDSKGDTADWKTQRWYKFIKLNVENVGNV